MTMVFPKSKVRIEIELLYHHITRKRLAEVEVDFIMNGIVYMKCAIVFIFWILIPIEAIISLLMVVYL